MNSLPKLTAKQSRFVEEYLVDFNATQAAIRAGYSERTARQIGEKTMRRPAVAVAIQDAMKKLSERTEVTQDMVIEGLLKEAQLYDDDSASHSARVSAWEKLGKHLGMFKERLEHSGPDGGPIPTMPTIIELVPKGVKSTD